MINKKGNNVRKELKKVIKGLKKASKTHLPGKNLKSVLRKRRKK